MFWDLSCLDKSKVLPSTTKSWSLHRNDAITEEFDRFLQKRVEAVEKKDWDRWKGNTPNLCPVFQIDERQNYSPCAQFECNFASVLFACDEVFYNSVCDTQCVYNVQYWRICNLFYRRTFSIVLLQSHLHIAVFINTHISDLNRRFRSSL